MLRSVRGRKRSRTDCADCGSTVRERYTVTIADTNCFVSGNRYLPFGTQGCSGVTDQTGIGSCSLFIYHVQPGTIVTIQVTFVYNGLQYQSTTSFME